MSYNKAKETVSLSFRGALLPGKATLVIEYAGVLNDKMRGFYRTKYNLHSSLEKECYAAVTQFEVCAIPKAMLYIITRNTTVY